MAPLCITITAAQENLKIARISGHADGNNIGSIDAEIQKILTEEKADFDLVLDGQNLILINSTFTAYLTDWVKKLECGGRQLVLAELQPKVLRVIQKVAKLKKLPHFASLEEAQASLA